MILGSNFTDLFSRRNASFDVWSSRNSIYSDKKTVKNQTPQIF